MRNISTIKILKTRRSIREYQNKQIPRAYLKEIIDVARFAATARNVQPWEFVIITKSEMLKKLGALAENAKFIAGAKACIAIFCADTKYFLEDGCSATVNILNAAAALGIGSCWVAGDKKPYSSQVASLLNVPQEFKLVSMISLGYPRDKAAFKLTVKKNLKEILHWEKF